MTKVAEVEACELEQSEISYLSVDDQLVLLDEVAARPAKPVSKLRSAWQRGMTTAEYAVGILAAVAFALVLLKIISGNEFFTAMLKFVVGLIGKIAGQLP